MSKKVKKIMGRKVTHLWGKYVINLRVKKSPIYEKDTNLWLKRQNYEEKGHKFMWKNATHLWVKKSQIYTKTNKFE